MVVLNPKDSRALIKLGDAMCLKEQYQNAIEAFLKAVALDTTDPVPYYHVGNAYYMLGQYHEAI